MATMGRHGWWLFVLVAVTGIVPGLALLVDPGLLDPLIGWFGHDPSFLGEGSGSAALGRWIGTVLLGSNLLTLAVAAGPFRRGERWAWWILWYWPASFAVHALIYAGSAKVPQLIWAIATSGVLLAVRFETVLVRPSRQEARGGAWQDSQA